MILRALCTLLAVAALATAALEPVDRAAGQTAALESFHGRYAFVGGPSETERLDHAIDRVVAQMNIFVREIARGELRRHVRPEQRIAIDVLGDDRLTLRLDEWGPVPVRLGAPLRVRGPDGSPTRVAGHYAHGRLLVRQVSSRGQRDNWLTLSPDGERMFLRVRVGADPLPDDVRYTLSYRRVR